MLIKSLLLSLASTINPTPVAPANPFMSVGVVHAIPHATGVQLFRTDGTSSIIKFGASSNENCGKCKTEVKIAFKGGTPPPATDFRFVHTSRNNSPKTCGYDIITTPWMRYWVCYNRPYTCFATADITVASLNGWWRLWHKQSNGSWREVPWRVHSNGENLFDDFVTALGSCGDSGYGEYRFNRYSNVERTTVSATYFFIVKLTCKSCSGTGILLFDY